MSQSVDTYNGWYAYHDFRKIDWNRWKSLKPSQRKEMIQELRDKVEEYRKVENNKEGSFAQYSVLSHEADLLLVHLRPSIEELNEVKFAWDKTGFADFTTASYSFLSVVELSAYTVPPGIDPLKDPAFRARLQPILPKTQYICFYPMNKRRVGDDNWFMLPIEERRRMMKSHGMIGRTYEGKVRQIVTGSTGLDDWEWGVSLFADDPLYFKKLVYEMRFDEASARFGEFGSFYIGNRLSMDGLTSLLADNINK
ncbi:MAG: hydrogen peroxide-dependent heme synthase [Thermoactinomyces sp.]